MRYPLLIVVSAPSGAGKSTLCDRLMATRDDIIYSVSCTTRAPRGDEKDGVDYHFLTVDEFRRRVAAGDFLEYAEVHGNLYGTLQDTVRTALDAGRSVMMDIDVQGASQVRATLAGLPDDDPMVRGFLDVFIMPPSMEELRNRLFSRGEDAPEVIEKRLANAAAEMEQAGLYKYRVVNDDLDQAFRQFHEIIEKESER